MLIRLEIENFYSVREPQTLDLRIPRTAPAEQRFVELPGTQGLRLPKVVALFGANASGKTTVLRAIPFLVGFATRSFNQYEPNDRVSILPFAIPECRESSTAIAIEYMPYSDIDLYYRYELIIKNSNENKNYVAWEAFRKSNDAVKYEMIFERVGSLDESAIRCSKEFKLPQKDPRRRVRPNVSLISSLIQFDHEEANYLANSLRFSFVTNVNVGKFGFSDKDATDYFVKHDWALKELNRRIRTIDVGIERVRIKEVSGEKLPVFEHRGLDGTLTLPFESQGTRNFFCFFPNLIYALETGSTAVLDELDSDLHPALMSEILRWFKATEGPKAAQLIMSCQNPSILAEMAKEEVVLVEKDENGSSNILPLSKFKHLRRDSNLYAKYLGGAFGAVPSFG